MPTLPGSGATLYRAAVFLYPPAFRKEFAPDMVRDFADASDETWADRGAAGLLLLWHQTTMDLLLTLMWQWWRTGLPAIGALSLLPSLAASIGIARLARALPLNVVLPRHDQETLTLLMLIATVVLLIAATIVFTHWFTAPLRNRRRV
jgi:hypothetical protein